MAINQNIKQKAADIRTKVFGSEVRESLASGLEGMSEDVESIKGRQGDVESQFQNVIDETTGKDVISAPELIAARNGKSNLKTRLDEEHAQVTAQLQQMESKKLDRNENESITNAMLSPEIKKALNDGVWEFSMNTSDIENGAVTAEKISPELLSEVRQVFPTKQLTGYDITTRNVAMADYAYSFVVRYPLSKTGKLILPKSTSTVGHLYTLGMFDESGNEYCNITTKNTSHSWATVTEENVILDISKMQKYDFIYASFHVNDAVGGDMYVGQFQNGIVLEDYLPEVVSKVDEGSIKAAHLDPNIYASHVTRYESTVLTGYNPEKVAVLSPYTSRYVERFDVYGKGYLDIPIPISDSHQTFVSGVYVNGVEVCDYNYRGVGNEWAQVVGDRMVIDLEKAPKMDFIYICYDYVNENGDSVYKNAIPLENLLVEAFTGGVETKQESEVEFIVPEVYPIVEGDTGYIYFDNVLLDGSYYKGIKVIADSSTTHAGSVEHTNVGADTTTTLRILDEADNAIEVTSIPIKVVPKSTGSGKSKKVMVMGESTTEATNFLEHLNSKLESDVIDFEMVGTRSTTSGIKHEGRSGFSMGMLRYLDVYKNITNSFFNPAKAEFDYSYYLAQNPTIPIPDYVFLNFGINGLTKAISGHDNETYIDYINFIVANMRSVSPEIKFILGLSTGVARWDNLYQSGNISLRKTIMNQNKAVIDTFSGKESEGIFLAPMYLNVDMKHDMRTSEKPVNQYSTKTLTFGTDPVHPDSSGYKKTGDVCYWSLKYAVSKEL